MKDSIRPEHSSDFSLNLKFIEKLISYFHASGNFFYATSAQLYWQDMLQLETMIVWHRRWTFCNGRLQYITAFFQILVQSVVWHNHWTIDEIHTQPGWTHSYSWINTKCFDQIYFYNECRERSTSMQENLVSWEMRWI